MNNLIANLNHKKIRKLDNLFNSIFIILTLSVLNYLQLHVTAIINLNDAIILLRKQNANAFL